jgi:hypothetical protein
MRGFKIGRALCLLSLAAAASAKGDTITLYVSGVDTGTLTITETGNDTLITGISGTFDNATIGSLIPPGGLGSSDNLYFTSTPYFDDLGVSFTLTGADSNGYTDVNLYWDVDVTAYTTEQSDSPLGSAYVNFSSDTVTTSASSVPEPGTVCLALFGLGCIFAARRFS